MAPLLIQNKSQSPYNAYKTLRPALPAIAHHNPSSSPNPHPNYPFPAMKTFLLFLKLTRHTLTSRALYFFCFLCLRTFSSHTLIPIILLIPHPPAQMSPSQRDLPLPPDLKLQTPTILYPLPCTSNILPPNIVNVLLINSICCVSPLSRSSVGAKNFLHFFFHLLYPQCLAQQVFNKYLLKELNGN